jgi:BRCA1-associated protein
VFFRLSLLSRNSDIALGPITASFESNTRTKVGSTNLPEGVVRVFRDSSSSTLSDEHNQPSSPSGSLVADPDTRHVILNGADADDVTLGVLAVPAWMTASDFLSFVAPAQEGIAHLRMIRFVQP